MILKILGSAAGGGFPQWNCSCRNCAGFRSGAVTAKARTQTQIAVSPGPGIWFLVAASPDLRTQIIANRELWPAPRGPGRSPIVAVFLPSADLDAVMGLLHLREFHSFAIYSTPAVQKIVRDQNSLFRVLDRANPRVQWHGFSAGQPTAFYLPGSEQPLPFFRYRAVSLAGNYPDYLDEAGNQGLPADQANVGLVIEQGHKKIFIAPSLSGENATWIEPVTTADVVLLDGTFWSDTELLVTGRSQKTARDMGHLPLSGADGLLARFPVDARGRKILIHINNTNPILDEKSAEHKAVLEAGFEIAYDGLTVEL
jgi:pyrroloquinoline quinone biosynthesis protein B